MAYIKGLKDGIKMIKPSLSKRKINLGARRLTDDEFGQLFFFGDHNWHLTRKNQCKPPSKHHIEITKASPEKRNLEDFPIYEFRTNFIISIPIKIGVGIFLPISVALLPRYT